MFNIIFERIFIMGISSSIHRRLAALKAMQFLTIASIVNEILIKYRTNKNLAIILIVLFLLLKGNDYIRFKYFRNIKIKRFYISYAISVIILGYLAYSIPCMGTQIYNIILLIETIVMVDKVQPLAIIFNFVIYSISYGAYLHVTKITDFSDEIVSYGMTLIIMFLFRSITFEKKRVDNLNDELKGVNSTLKEYTAKIEELTITKERTRIAQELHDSIGHSLVALKMNLEYAENVVDLKPEKAKEVINKAQGIAKDCIMDLREAVSLLREESSVEKLRHAIVELFQKFKETNSVRLNLDMDDKVETSNPDIKNCVYKTVREAVTNGIKHGKATLFHIGISTDSDNIILKIKNNGLECDTNTIVKSNGVRGIEDRIRALGGTVNFISEKGLGFAIEAVIPILDGGELKND